MNFEKRMKKHIDQTLEENVPNPYPKKSKPSFPHWLKVATPIGTGVLALGLACAIIVPVAMASTYSRSGKGHNSSINKGGRSSSEPLPPYGYNPTVAAPKQRGMFQMNSNLVKRVATKSLSNLDFYFQDPSNKNFVLSPASFLLAASGFAAVSDGFDLDAFGLVDAEEDTKALLDNWNRYWEDDGKVICKIDSGVLHQQVGPTYQFDKNKAAEIEDSYIGTAAAPLNGYIRQAEDYFKEKVDLTIPVPDLYLQGDGVITYGAISLVDYAGRPFRKAQNAFYIDGNPVSVETGLFGENAQGKGMHTNYYEGETYETFTIPIGSTSLLIVLPKEGVSLESVPLTEAYTNGISYQARSKDVFGYIPFFNLQTFDFDVMQAFANHLTGQEKLYSKIVVDSLKDHVNLSLRAKQSSEFCFNEYGVSGQSVTAVGGSSALPPKTMPTELNVNRPFYAISLKDDFPLFVNKVNDPRS